MQFLRKYNLYYENQNSQKGQLLIPVIFVMLIVLSASVVISSRFFKSLHVFTKSDNATKATCIAEALAERLLYQSDDTLSDYVLNNTCIQDCQLSFEDGAEAYAEIAALGNSADTYTFKISKDTTSEVNLQNYPSGSYLDVCWNEKSSISAMYVYENAGDYKVENYAYSAVASEYDSNFEVAGPLYSYANCFRIDTSNTPVLVRVKALYENTWVSVIPEPSSVLPNQGFKINSNGRFLDAYKRVSVTKKSSIAPEIFDYIMYQKSTDTTLSK